MISWLYNNPEISAFLWVAKILSAAHRSTASVRSIVPVLMVFAEELVLHCWNSFSAVFSFGKYSPRVFEWQSIFGCLYLPSGDVSFVLQNYEIV